MGKVKNTIFQTIGKWPLQSFVGLLGLLMVLIVIGNIIRTPKTIEKEPEKPAKEVEIYSIGKAPRMSISAKVEKTGIVKITALSGGIVQKIYRKEGEHIQTGEWLAYLSTNQQGAVAPSLSRQIAEKNYKFLEDTYNTQKEILAKNKEVADKAESQATDLRDIANKSVDETKSLIALNENTISMIDEQIKGLEAINVNGASNSALISLKSGKISVLASLNQAKAALRQTEYSSSSDNEPAQIAVLQRDITRRQLDIQEKSLDLNKDVALLNLRLAQIQESLMYPTTPVCGTVERIHVKVGQMVAPGTVLATVLGDETSSNVVAFTSSHIANTISQLEPSTIHLDGRSIKLYPSYISHEPTEGNLHTIMYSIPDGYTVSSSNDEVVQVDVPIGNPSTNSHIPYIPLDAIYQTKDSSYIYVVSQKGKDTITVSRIITLGQVYGSYVEVTDGLKDADKIIMDRTVVEGEKIKPLY